MSFPECEWPKLHRKVYGEGATFVPVCPSCGRFVKADATVLINGLGEIKNEANASCTKCGRVQMPFEGYV